MGGPNPFTGAQAPSSKVDDQSSQNGYPSGGGGGYGGGGASSGPSAEQVKGQQNLGGISGYNFETPGLMYDYGSQTFDEADKFLGLQRDEMFKRSKRKAGNEWYKQQQNLQSVASQLSDASANAMNGSFLYDFWDLLARRDDQDDVAVLNEMRENMDNALSDYWEGIQANINARNDLAMDTEQSRRDVFADYVAQSNNIHPDLAEDMIDREGHTLNEPDWLKTDFFKEHFRKAAQPTSTDLFRPANTADTANEQRLIDKDRSSMHSSAANSDYWTRARMGYGRRGQ